VVLPVQARDAAHLNTLPAMKTAVVTGGASGIGRCTVGRLLKEGWFVWTLDVSREPIEELSLPDSGDGQLRRLHCAVSLPSSVQNAFSLIGKECPKVDALGPVNTNREVHRRPTRS
jgi:NAD(P)-dependent dehydrogenase (short-subunit alcohol dehydrogenase family)